MPSANLKMYIKLTSSLQRDQGPMGSRKESYYPEMRAAGLLLVVPY